MSALAVLVKTFRLTSLFSDPDKRLLQVFNPFNGADYVHIDRVVRVDDADNYKAWEGRGDVVRVEFWDEDGGEFALCFGEHKGNVYFWVEDGAAQAPKRRRKARAEAPVNGDASTLNVF